MGKIIFKVVVMLIIVLGMSNYALYIKTGKSPFTGSDFKLPFDKPSASSLIPAGKQQAFKWTDENGVVHYSSEAPPEGNDVSVLQVDPNTNLIQGIKREEEAEEQQKTAAEPTMPQGNVYNPETIRKLIDDAKQVQETLNDRYSSLEEL